MLSIPSLSSDAHLQYFAMAALPLPSRLRWYEYFHSYAAAAATATTKTAEQMSVFGTPVHFACCYVLTELM